MAPKTSSNTDLNIATDGALITSLGNLTKLTLPGHDKMARVTIFLQHFRMILLNLPHKVFPSLSKAVTQTRLTQLRRALWQYPFNFYQQEL